MLHCYCHHFPTQVWSASILLQEKTFFYISVFICCYNKCSARSFVPFWFCFSHAILLASPISCYNFHFQTSILMQMKWFKARFRCLLPVRLSIATPVLLMYVMFPKPKVSSLVFHVVWFFLEETRIFNWSSTACFSCCLIFIRATIQTEKLWYDKVLQCSVLILFLIVTILTWYGCWPTYDMDADQLIGYLSVLEIIMISSSYHLYIPYPYLQGMGCGIYKWYDQLIDNRFNRPLPQRCPMCECPLKGSFSILIWNCRS